MLGNLEPEGLDLSVTLLEASEEAGTSKVVVEEILTDRGLKASVHETVEVDEEGEEIAKPHACIPSITIVNPLSSSFFEVGHILPSL